MKKALWLLLSDNQENWGWRPYREAADLVERKLKERGYEVWSRWWPIEEEPFCIHPEDDDERLYTLEAELWKEISEELWEKYK